MVCSGPSHNSAGRGDDARGSMTSRDECELGGWVDGVFVCVECFVAGGGAGDLEGAVFGMEGVDGLANEVGA